MTNLKIIIILSLLFFTTIPVLAQGRYSVDRPLKQRNVGLKFIYKQTKENYRVYRENIKIKRAENKASREIIRHQRQIQDKKTLKRMRESRRISKRINKFGTDLPWHKRLYHKIKKRLK